MSADQGKEWGHRETLAEAAEILLEARRHFGTVKTAQHCEDSQCHRVTGLKQPMLQDRS